MRPSVNVIIVSYNVRPLLERCLESVFADADRTGVRVTVHVVDNASSDGSAEMVRRRFPYVRLTASRRNLGFAAANNLAMKEALNSPTPPDYFFLLNPDTEVREGAIETLLRFMEAHPQAGMCGPKLLYPDGRLQHSAFRFPGLGQLFLDLFPLHPRLMESRLNGRYPRRLYERGQPFAIDHPLGAAMMVRREAMEQVGFMDGGFFIYCEEIDWCIRMKRAGWGIFCVPAAEVVHHVAGSTSQFRQAMFVELWRSRRRLYAKYRGSFYLRVAGMLVQAGMQHRIRQARKAAARGLISPEELKERVWAYRQVASIWRE